MKLTPALRADYEKKWATCEVDYQKTTVMAVARRVLAVKQTCSFFWDVPWWFVALCWLRECDLDPKGSLAQGDPWNKVSTHVPKGRGPFKTWRAAAEDALRLMGYDKIKDWSVAPVLFMFENFNGPGYRNKGVPSPYLWSHTNHYADGSWDDDPKGGKYYADRKWSADIYDSQIGVCAVLKCLMEIDKTIKFGAVAVVPPPPDVPPVVKRDVPTDPVPQRVPPPKPLVKSKTLWASIAAAFTTAGSALLDAAGDWRIWCAIVVIALLAYVVWERSGRPDIRGLVR